MSGETKPATSREVTNLLNMNGLYRRKLRQYISSGFGRIKPYEIYQVKRQRSKTPAKVLFEMEPRAPLVDWIDAIDFHNRRE